MLGWKPGLNRLSSVSSWIFFFFHRRNFSDRPGQKPRQPKGTLPYQTESSASLLAYQPLFHFRFQISNSWILRQGPKCNNLFTSKHVQRIIYGGKAKQGGKPSKLVNKMRETTFGYLGGIEVLSLSVLPQTAMCGAYYSLWKLRGISVAEQIIAMLIAHHPWLSGVQWWSIKSLR